jgi:hypothetical protein
MASDPSVRPLGLIIVCCHAIFIGADPLDEAHWALESFQKSNQSTGKPGEHLTFVKHIQAAFSLFINPESSQEDRVLIFSGGPTKASQPGKSEARSYQEALKILENLNGFPIDQQNSETRHIGLEENATDSFQNVLFGLIECNRLVGRYPDTVKVVTHEFKKERIEEHRKAIRWDRNWETVGINPPFSGNQTFDQDKPRG